MSSQAPEKAARFSAKHQLETWSRKQGSTSPATIMQVPVASTELSLGKGIILARAADIELDLDGSVTTADGITLQAGDVVFCPIQIDPVDNGLWVVQPDGAPWVRLDGGLEDWVLVIVRGGATFGGSVWRCTTDSTAEVGTDELNWDMLVDSQMFSAHVTSLADSSTQGHVIIDDVTIKTNGSNKIYAVLSGSGTANYAVAWTGTSSIGYASEVQFGVAAGAIHVSTSARIGVSVNQTGDYRAVEIVRNGAGAATSPTVSIDAQDATDGTAALQVSKAGTGVATANNHSGHGVAENNATSGSGTNAVITVTEAEGKSTGTPAAGFGVRHRWLLQSSTTASQQAGAIQVEWVTATHASRKARVKHLVSDTTEREALRLEADGTQVLIGLYGANAVARAAAITKPGVAPATYNQTWGGQLVTAINALVDAIKGIGITN